jgi:hypothetical protein
MHTKEEPTGKDRGLTTLTGRFYGDNLLDSKFSVNNSVRFITRKGSRDHPADFRFLETNLRYLEAGAKYYIDVVAHCFRNPEDFWPSAMFLNVWLTLVAVRPLGSKEYQRIAAITKQELPSLLLLKDPPPSKEFLNQLEFGKLVEFPARITVGMPMIFELAAEEFQVLRDASSGGSR